MVNLEYRFAGKRVAAYYCVICIYPLSAAGEERVNNPPEAEMFG
jgi:hypothetical protein